MASELAVKARTLMEVKSRLQSEVDANSKRIGFQRALDVVTDMHLELLNDVIAEQNEAPAKVQKVSG